jgi:hypothetical protein
VKAGLRNALVPAVTVAAMAATFLAATPWLRAYQVRSATVMLALAAVIPCLLSLAVSRALRFAPLVAFGASVTGMAVLLLAATAFSAADLWQGLSRVPAQLLTETLPLSGPAYLMVAPVMLTWACSSASAELLLRPRLPSGVALAVPVVYFALSYAATTSAPPGGGAPEAAGLLAAVVAGALARQALTDAATTQARSDPPAMAAGEGERPAHRHSTARRAATAAVLSAALAAGLAAVVPTIPAFASRPATVSRPTQLLSGTVIDPVDALAYLRAANPLGKGPALYSVSVNRPWQGYMAVAALDRYDGDVWSFASTFRPTGGRVPYNGPPLGNRATLRQRYHFTRSIGVPFLPAVDRPTEVSGPAVDADPGTGMLVASSPVTYYGVTSAVPGPTAVKLASDSALMPLGQLPGGGTLTELPAGSEKFVASAVKFAIDLTGQPASPSFAFLQDLAVSLADKEHRAVPRPGPAQAPPAQAGTSLAQVMNAVTVVRAAAPEQFATFFAVVARYLGVPVRVVTGFRVPGRPGALALPAGTYTVHAGDAWSWDEVPVVGRGWVVVDATPLATTTDLSAPPEQVKAAKPRKPKTPAALPGGTSHALAKRVEVATRTSTPPDWSLVLGAGVPAGALVALAMVLLGAPAARRRFRRLARRRSEDPGLLAAGAWLEMVDGLSRLGLEVPQAATGTEVAHRVGERFGGECGATVANVSSLADRALYSTRWPLDQASAEQAWQAQHALYRDVRARVGRRQRARALLAVGPAPARPSSPAAGSVVAGPRPRAIRRTGSRR